MRVAFFTDTYHPSLDGVVRSLDAFGRGLRHEGHEVRMFAPAPAAAHMHEAGVSYAPSVAFPAYPQYRIPLHEGGLRRAARQFGPEIIHSHAMLKMGLAARGAASELGVPLVGTFHTLVPQAAHYVMPIAHLHGWAGRRMWDYLRWFYSPFDELMAPSRFLARALKEEGLDARVVPNPVDTEFFTPEKERKERKKRNHDSHSRPCVLFVGRLAKEKNLDFLLEMAAQKEWQEWGAELVMAGEGPYRKTLEQRAKKENITEHVLFLGRVPDAKLPSLYRSASCFVQPSLFETQGLSALEAMACGTPAAVRAGTALAEVARRGVSGEWFGHDAKGAVEVVRRLCEKRGKYSVGARAVALEHSIPKCTDRLIETYEKAGG